MEKAEEGIEKSKSRMSLPVLIVTSVVTQWSSNLVDTVSSTHVVTSPTVTILKPLPKKLALLVQPVVKVRSSNVRQKRNRVFYGCDRYPDCEFTSWDIPVGRNCPKSGDYLVEKKVRGGGKQVICSNEECDYKESIVK